MRSKIANAHKGVRRGLAGLLVAILCLAGLASGARAQSFESKVDFAILIDVATDTVLYQKRADDRMPPASMAKLMTSVLAFDALKSGKLNFGSMFTISENAWRKGGAGSGGSTMFAKVNSQIQLADLLRGIVVQSGNDACIAFAEGLAGSEPSFAALMNDKAKQIGMTGTHFTNATGLPDQQQYTTARDLARLARFIITEYPEYYKIYGERDFTWNKIRQTNRNPLLDMNIGADGLKTGNTDASGFGLVGSAVQNGRRLIVVVNGAKTDKERSEESRKLLEWGFRSFTPTDLFDANSVIAQARVYGGAKDTVGLRSKAPIQVLLPSNPLDKVKIEVVYAGPLPAPVKEGDPAGALVVHLGEQQVSSTPLFTAEAVPQGGFYQRALGAVHELLLGWW